MAKQVSAEQMLQRLYGYPSLRPCNPTGMETRAHRDLGRAPGTHTASSKYPWADQRSCPLGDNTPSCIGSKTEKKKADKCLSIPVKGTQIHRLYRGTAKKMISSSDVCA